jgi:exonuclease III
MAENFSVISWNMRGLNMPARREAVRGMLSSSKPAVVCLQETKMALISVQTAREILGQRMDRFLCLPATGTTGGILVGWDSEQVEVANQTAREHSLSMTVTIKSLHANFLMTTVYGPADEARKPAFLIELQQLKPPAQTTWLVVGDFNMIYQTSDKNNLNLNRRLMGTFRQAINLCQLSEYNLQNRQFTWSNEREEATLVRLDRCFCNKEFDLVLSDHNLIALSSSLSDHCPILICQQARHRG